MRAKREKQDSEAEARIIEAMLVACGERGYRKATVQDVLDRCGGHRVQFYRHFANKAECYAVAYATEIERLCEALLGAARAQETWRAGLRAALEELARFAGERPALARGLLAEAQVAGGPALPKREEVLERLSRAVDSARRETESRHDPPPVTATFMVGAIEAAVTSALSKGKPEEFAAAVPELTGMVVAAYFGEQPVGEGMAEPGASGVEVSWGQPADWLAAGAPGGCRDRGRRP
jgi:AcrR family transcriptional regulator